MSLTQFIPTGTQLVKELKTLWHSLTLTTLRNSWHMSRPKRSYPAALSRRRWKDNLLPNCCMLHGKVFVGIWIAVRTR